MDLKQALMSFAEKLIDRTAGIEEAVDDLVAVLSPAAPAAEPTSVAEPAPVAATISAPV